MSDAQGVLAIFSKKIFEKDSPTPNQACCWGSTA
jgi:hypothetical protein